LKSDGGSSPLLQRIIIEWLKDGNLPAHVARAQALYRSHRDHMVAALRRDLDGDVLTRHAADHGVTILPGSKFYAANGPGYPHNEGPPRNQIRLTYSFATEAQIEEGVRQLGNAVSAARST